MSDRFFEFHLDPTIPELAWLAILKTDTLAIVVLHGSGVETDSDGARFFEGAWAGSFSDWNFDSTAAFGTGGRVEEGEVAFFPPDHVLDQLFLRRIENTLLVSNSMAFVMAASDASLPTDRCDYFAIYGRMIDGLKNFRSSFPLTDGGEITGWLCKTLCVGADLTVTAADKPLDAPFETFGEYRHLLTSTMQAVFDNARAPDRVRTYALMGSISSGYDSTAISTLAAELDCCNVFTFTQSRPRLLRPAEDDSGSEAARVLGLEVQEVDRLAYRAWEDMIEIEGYGAGSEIFSARNLLQGKVFLSGYMGDTMWDREPAVVSNSLCWPLPAGHNLGEFRLAAGLVHVPVPFIGAWRQPKIVEISQSAEMAPWRLGTAYDRPICRRIAEEKGIPRKVFGVKKRASAVFFREEGLQATMSRAAYCDYSAFRKTHSPFSRGYVRSADRVSSVVSLINAVFRKLKKLGDAHLGVSLPLVRLPDRPGLRSEAALLFPWATERLKQRYQSPHGHLRKPFWR